MELQVHSVSISKDSSTGLSKGFGFVKYMNKEAADKAKATLNGTPLKDFPELKASTRSLPQDPPGLAGFGSCYAGRSSAFNECNIGVKCLRLRAVGCCIKDCPLHDSFRPALQVRVLPSQAKNRLYVGNIPKSLTHDQLVDMLKPLTKGAPAAANMTLAPTLACSCYTLSFQQWREPPGLPWVHQISRPSAGRQSCNTYPRAAHTVCETHSCCAQGSSP